MRLILASSSVYRQALLKRLQLPFETYAPDVDETPLAGEPAEQLARRLSLAKARAVAVLQPGATIIGSDQVASLSGRLLGKPGTAARARVQLAQSSGQLVEFHTAICVIASNGTEFVECVRSTVQFRHLQAGEIDRYLELERPWDCAGSFKWESLGISLFERLRGDDPTALEGLPLICLSKLLRQLGIDALSQAAQI